VVNFDLVFLFLYIDQNMISSGDHAKRLSQTQVTIITQ